MKAINFTWRKIYADVAGMAAPGSYNTQRQVELAKQQRIKANNMRKQNF